MRRSWRIALGALAALSLGAGGAYGYRRWKVAREPAVILPRFEEPKPGPRAKTSEGLGFVVGRTRASDVGPTLAALGGTCQDTSMRALMQERRKAAYAQIEAKKARGEDVDAISQASWLTHKSKKEKNPQLRLSCEGVSAIRLKDRKRADGVGRVLVIFDSETHPLRHVSYSREIVDHELALREFGAAVAAFTGAWGAPTTVTGVPPASAPGVEVPIYKPFARTWRFSDLEAKVELLHLGKRGLRLVESLEVPWPVRPDAPAL